MKGVIGLGLLIAAVSQPAGAQDIPDPKSVDSPIAWTKILVVETSVALDRWVSRIDMDEDSHYQTFDIVRKSWCPRVQGFSDAQAISREMGRYCTAHNGEWEAPFCKSSDQMRGVLFASVVKPDPSGCSSTSGAFVELYVPKEEVRTEEFDKAMFDLGYRTPEQSMLETALQHEANEQLEAAKRHEQLAAMGKRQRELPLKKQIGARICQASRGVVYVGFTEGYSRETGKIQIRISDAHFDGSRGIRPGGFQPSIIWDHPSNWNLCE